MDALLADERGRVTLGADAIGRYGKKFYLVSMPKKIVLLPVPKDPLKHLEELGKKAGIGRYSIKELRQMAREEAEKEAMKHVR